MKRKVIAVVLWLIAASIIFDIFSNPSNFIGDILMGAVFGFIGYKVYLGSMEVDPAHPELMKPAARKKYDQIVTKLLTEAVHMPRDQFDVLVAGQVPVVYNTPAMLDQDEQAHFWSEATLIITKRRVVGHTGGSSGVKIKVAKGLSYRVGASEKKSVYGDVQDRYQGQFVITNKKVIFINPQKGFSCTFRSIHAATAPDANSLTIQTSDKVYDMYVPLAPNLMRLIGYLKSGATQPIS